MSGRVILYGGAHERFEGERVLRGAIRRCTSSRWRTAGSRRAGVRGEFDVAVVTRGPIAEHDERMAASPGCAATLAGRILAAGRS
jgi:hypothetical protein